MIAEAGEILSIYSLVFWHALTVSLIAWVLLPVGLLMRGRGTRTVTTVLRVFAATAAVGFGIMMVGAVHGPAASGTPDYVHGMACVFGVASAMTVTWAIGRAVRLALAEKKVGALFGMSA